MSAERGMDAGRVSAREFLGKLPPDTVVSFPSLAAEGNRMSVEEQVVRLLCDGSSGDKEFEEGMVRAFLECLALSKTRHRKYGRGNIAAFADAGCLVRDSDKSARLARYYFEGAQGDFDDETVIDSWRDKVNYSLFGLMCYIGTFPGVVSNERAPEAA